MGDALVRRGAEAELWKTDWLGMPALKKVRVPKAYRAKALDEKIRGQRTFQEARILHAVKQWKVNTPFVLEVQPEKALIVMEWVEGPTLKEALQNSRTVRAKKLKWCLELGKTLGILHNHEMVHGDLTTSNVLVRGHGKKSKLVLVDFGLAFYSRKVEDLAVDVLGLKKTYAATHYDFPRGWNAILQGYSRTFKNAKSVLRHMEKVEGRVRYA